MKGGYAGDMPFQNTVNFFRGIGNNLGNVVHGFRGYPEVAGPSPVDQPGMDPPRMPVPMPADIETLYKTAQTNVGSIGSIIINYSLNFFYLININEYSKDIKRFV